MPTLVCVPIMLEHPPAGHASGAGEPVAEPGLAGAVSAALADAVLAKDKGADLVEFRIDSVFEGAEQGPDADELDAYTVAEFRRLLAESPLPVILTCRPTWEGGEYDGDDSDRVALFEKLCCDTEHPPAYLDIELAAYTRSANLRQKINLCVTHPKQQRKGVSTRLILSTHDFDSRPADLDRRLLAMYDERACAVVKVAYRARSLRDNLDLFEILRESPKPTIALGMGEFGLMSRVLAPKFNAFLTFASLRDQAATAPGQPTIDNLLGLYRFRKIGKQTKLYGVIGWPVGHSLSPLIHNAGFEQISWDGVYLPLPIAADENDHQASETSLRVTLDEMAGSEDLDFAGASVTLPHKQNAARWCNGSPNRRFVKPEVEQSGAANTLERRQIGPGDEWQWDASNTDIRALDALMDATEGPWSEQRVAIIGSGGAARALAFELASRHATVVLYNRTVERAEQLADEINAHCSKTADAGKAVAVSPDLLPKACCHAFINCTPVGMTGGPDPDGLSIPIPEMTNIDENTVFFDTVYNPVETPMLRAARERGCRTIDGVEMFVRQAAAQFELWTAKTAPVTLFDRLCRERLA
jgi:3-dehydroquinate dehydratase/shikimate dehydrogenase